MRSSCTSCSASRPTKERCSLASAGDTSASVRLPSPLPSPLPSTPCCSWIAVKTLARSSARILARTPRVSSAHETIDTSSSVGVAPAVAPATGTIWTGEAVCSREPLISNLALFQ